MSTILVNTLFTVPKAQSGAARTVTEALVQHMAKLSAGMGVNLYLLASEAHAGYWLRLCPQVKLFVVKARSSDPFRRVLLEQFAARHAVRKTKADVYYSSSGALPMVPVGCRTVVYLQNILFFHFDEFYSRNVLRVSWKEWASYYVARNAYSLWACKHSLRLADEVIAVSRTMASEATAHTGIDRNGHMHVIPYGVNSEFFCPTGGRPLEKPYILSVSNILPHKRYELCLRVFAAAKRTYAIEHDLVILGTGPEDYQKSILELAGRLGIGNSVRIMGYVEHEQLPAWYAHAEAFVLTSGCESFGLPIIEAMASGTPVLVTEASGMTDTTGDSALVAATDDEALLAKELHRILTDTALRERLRLRGQTRAAQFSWDRAASDTLQVMLSGR